MTAKTSPEFYALYAQGFCRVGVATHPVHSADPLRNADQIQALMKQADAQNVAVLVFPELGLSAYAIDDLLLQDSLLQAVETQVQNIVAVSKDLLPVTIIGAPLRWRGRLLNCAIVIHRGEILGVVPKSYLPNYREFYESRHFSRATSVPAGSSIQLGGKQIPLGTDLLFEANDIAGLCLGVEICEDAWVPIPPSTKAAMAGATVLANLSASNAVIGKSDYRHALCQVQSAQCYAAYLYCAAGVGESTTDLAWDGHAMIYENGALMAQAERFSDEAQLVIRDVDIERLVSERARHGSFTDCASDHFQAFRRVEFSLNPPIKDLGLEREVDRFPFVPNDQNKRDALCAEAFEIQSQGLAHRLKKSGIKKIVIGVSGGLDSSHALLVAAHAFDRLGYDRKNILAYTLPAYATSQKTKSSAWDLMRSLGVCAQEIDLTAACDQMLADISHPASKGVAQYDIAFENVQAGARTSLLFRLANHHDALVLGTGDLSELALGWCTYGVGDHMSHYNVNASVPKTLIQHLIAWVAEQGLYGPECANVLQVILSTEISPELIPGDSKTAPAQSTEESVGPYALQDFNTYYITRFGMRPSKVAFLAWHSWRSNDTGEWPQTLPDDKRVSYDLETIRFWLRSFLWRFFQTSQFKRTAVPNGPKISSGGSLSPRGDWRAPADSHADVWIAELDQALPAPKEK